jgi:hypothetical protein
LTADPRSRNLEVSGKRGRGKVPMRTMTVDPIENIGNQVDVWYVSGPNRGCGQGGTLAAVTANTIVLNTSYYGVQEYDRSIVEIHVEVPLDADECLEFSDECRGPVDYRMLGNSSRAFPRCEYHLDKRLELEEQINERYPVNPPADWDYLDAGEYWSEDDY